MEVETVPLGSCSDNDLIGMIIVGTAVASVLGCVVYVLWRTYRG